MVVIWDKLIIKRDSCECLNVLTSNTWDTFIDRLTAACPTAYGVARIYGNTYNENENRNSGLVVLDSAEDYNYVFYDRSAHYAEGLRQRLIVGVRRRSADPMSEGVRRRSTDPIGALLSRLDACLQSN